MCKRRTRADERIGSFHEGQDALVAMVRRKSSSGCGFMVDLKVQEFTSGVCLRFHLSSLDTMTLSWQFSFTA